VRGEREKLPSEALQDFLTWMKACQDEYEASKAIVQEEESKHQDFWHALELEPKAEKRSRIATVIHNSRVRRREAKDKMQMLERVVLFARKEQTKLLFRELKKLIKEQAAEEARIYGEREYKPRTDALTGGVQDGANPS